MLSEFCGKTPDLISEEELEDYFLHRKNVNKEALFSCPFFFLFLFLVRISNTCSHSKKDSFQVDQKVIPVAAVKKDILAIQTPGDDMMNRTGDIESSVSMHATMTATRQINVN
jgi:hypothetical protein